MRCIEAALLRTALARHTLVISGGDCGGMNTDTNSVSREVHEFYLIQINKVIADGRESLISSLVADYDQLVSGE
jgi:6-phosphofructokinase